MKKILLSITIVTVLVGGFSFGEVSNANVLSDEKAQSISGMAPNIRTVSYVFNHRPPIFYRNRRLVATQYLGQGQYRGYYN